MHIIGPSQYGHNGQIMCVTFQHATIGSPLTSRQDTNPSRPSGPQNFELNLHEDHKSGQLRGYGTLFLPIHYTTFREYEGIASHSLLVAHSCGLHASSTQNSEDRSA